MTGLLLMLLDEGRPVGDQSVLDGSFFVSSEYAGHEFDLQDAAPEESAGYGRVSRCRRDGWQTPFTALSSMWPLLDEHHVEVTCDWLAATGLLPAASRQAFLALAPEFTGTLAELLAVAVGISSGASA